MKELDKITTIIKKMFLILVIIQGVLLVIYNITKLNAMPVVIIFVNGAILGICMIEITINIRYNNYLKNEIELKKTIKEAIQIINKMQLEESEKKDGN